MQYFIPHGDRMEITNRQGPRTRRADECTWYETSCRNWLASKECSRPCFNTSWSVPLDASPLTFYAFKAINPKSCSLGQSSTRLTSAMALLWSHRLKTPLRLHSHLHHLADSKRECMRSRWTFLSASWRGFDEARLAVAHGQGRNSISNLRYRRLPALSTEILS